MSVDVYKEEKDKQIQAWLDGNSYHLHSYNECVPDASCCDPTVKWTRHQKLIYLTSSKPTQAEIFSMTVTKIASELGVNITFPQFDTARPN